jgi:hypothetical protein
MLIRTLREMAEELFGFRVEEVIGNRVGSEVLGLTDFNKRTIKVPRTGRREIDEYVAGHEYAVEAIGHPRTEQEHAELEAEYLGQLRENGEWGAYLTGLAMHKLRSRYGDKTGFSGMVFRCLDRYIKNPGKDLEMASAYEGPLESVYGLNEAPAY